MLRIPTISLALFALGMIIGVATNNKPLGVTLGGLGSLVGYVFWLRSRVGAIRGGKRFHLGSVLNTVLCTFLAVGIGLFGLFGEDSLRHGGGMFILLLSSVLAVGLQWRAAKEAHTLGVLPTAGDVAREAVGTVFAEEAGPESFKALIEVGGEMIKTAGSSRTAESKIKKA